MELQAALGGDDYYKQLEKVLAQPKSRHQWEELVVNAPFSNPKATALLGLGIVVLLLVNKKGRTIDRIAVANTEMTMGTFAMTAKPFREIKIPLGYHHNFIARAIKENHYMITSDWQYLFNPSLTPEQARFNQAGGGIACSVVYPLPHILDGGAMIFSYYEALGRISAGHHNFMTRYVSLVQKSFNRLPAHQA
ncbi:MAG TPA: hypothetical protein VFP35_01575 [Candidatus Saccharimonadales bacterium]|nr:hypothetical protein [Candidatus Saccharimonadales bacterium]